VGPDRSPLKSAHKKTTWRFFYTDVDFQKFTDLSLYFLFDGSVCDRMMALSRCSCSTGADGTPLGSVKDERRTNKIASGRDGGVIVSSLRSKRKFRLISVRISNRTCLGNAISLMTLGHIAGAEDCKVDNINCDVKKNEAKTMCART